MSLKIANIDVAVNPTLTPGDPAAGPYDPFNPTIKELRKGHRRAPENRAFDADTIFEKDISLPMRDGARLYADVFRPKTTEKVPAILIWSPYGKTGNGPHGLGMIAGRFGVPQSEVSGYEKFEGLDPAVWPSRGYAIVNVDLRGSWDSEGIVPWLGEQDGKDGHDAIEYVATLSWCSGKVALAGNSWLAMVQWHIAAQQPPSLAAIAPWEGAADFYRDTLCRGGVPYPYDTMWKLLQDTMVGRNGTEAPIPMLDKYPLFNDYWEDKRSKLENINVPAYILASYSSSLHTTGSIRAYNTIASKDKWLRIHAKQEWSDLYDPANVDDLNKFFDFYPSVANVPSTSFPIPQTKYTKLYLDFGGKLSTKSANQAGGAFYNAEFSPKTPLEGEEELVFSHRFAKQTWLLGYSWVVLHIKNDSQNDIDVFVQLGKADASGKHLVNMNVLLQDLIPPVNEVSEAANTCFLKYLGPTGALRASHAVSKVTPEPGKFSGDWPDYSHTTRKEIPAGTMTRLEVPIWPTGIVFDEGESLTLKVSGHYMSFMEFEVLYGASHRNKGRHTVCFGGEFDSHLVVPLLDPIS